MGRKGRSFLAVMACLQVGLVVSRATGLTAMPWRWVLLPTWFGPALVLAVIILIAFVLAAAWIVDLVMPPTMRPRPKPESPAEVRP